MLQLRWWWRFTIDGLCTCCLRLTTRSLLLLSRRASRKRRTRPIGRRYARSVIVLCRRSRKRCRRRNAVRYGLFEIYFRLSIELGFWVGLVLPLECGWVECKMVGLLVCCLIYFGRPCFLELYPPGLGIGGIWPEVSTAMLCRMSELFCSVGCAG